MSAGPITAEDLIALSQYVGYNSEEGYLYWKKQCGARGTPGTKILGMSNGYYRFKFKGKSFLSHRVAFCLYHKVTLLANELVDHKDQNKLNMKINNLRRATESQNRFNSKPRANKLGEPNISIQYGRYRVMIRSKSLCFNSAYDTLEQAIKVRDAMKAKIAGEFLCQ